jgi:isopenicillin-N epimerase
MRGRLGIGTEGLVRPHDYSILPRGCDSTLLRLRDQFLLDQEIVYLTHGTYGACPRQVLDEYQRWQRELEREPAEFLSRRFDELVGEARSALAAYLGAAAADLVFVANATTAMNTVARSLGLGPGDEVLISDQEYGAIELIWAATGARVVRASPDSLWEHVTAATRVFSISHVASPTGAILPVAELCAQAREAGLFSVVDGAHAPGHVPVDLPAIAADAYAGNCHKWMCAPKGAGFLWVHPEVQERIDPLVVSWGWPEEEFAKRHARQGTRDPAAWLAVPAAIEFQRAWGWDEVRARCHALIERFVAESGLPPAAAEFGQMLAVELPPCDPEEVRRRLFGQHRVEVPCFEHAGRPLLRISVQGYNDESDVERLLAALPEVVG